MSGCHFVGSLIIHSVSKSETHCKGYDIIYSTVCIFHRVQIDSV